MLNESLLKERIHRFFSFELHCLNVVSSWIFQQHETQCLTAVGLITLKCAFNIVPKMSSYPLEQRKNCSRRAS